MKSTPLTLTAVLLLALPSAKADPKAGADARHFDEQVRPFLLRHCRECHGGEKPKGRFHLDRLAPDFAGQDSRDRWRTVLEQLQAGTMPPKAKPRPPAKEAQALADWISGRITVAEADRRAAQGRVVLRRLNRLEYENTIRDLLGISVDLKELLPPDSSSDGFDNVGEALHISSFLMEQISGSGRQGPEPGHRQRSPAAGRSRSATASRRRTRSRSPPSASFASWTTPW